MKRKIYPASFIYIFTMTVYFLSFLSGLVVIVMCISVVPTIKNFLDILALLSATAVGLFPVLLFGYIISFNIPNKMIITDDGIIVTGQKVKNGTQHRIFIEFSKIKNIKIIFDRINSQGKRIKVNSTRTSRPNLFFIFELQNEMPKLVYIEIYSIRQRKKILEIVNQMTGLNFSYNELERVDKYNFNVRCEKDKGI